MGATIYINNKQSALVLHEDGTQKLYLPPMKDEDNISYPTFILCTIAILLKIDDKRFQKYIEKRYNEL